MVSYYVIMHQNKLQFNMKFYDNITPEKMCKSV